MGPLGNAGVQGVEEAGPIGVLGAPPGPPSGRHCQYLRGAGADAALHVSYGCASSPKACCHHGRHATRSQVTRSQVSAKAAHHMEDLMQL